MNARTIEDFRREHDPSFRIENPTQVYTRDLKKNCKVFIVVAAQNATPVNPDWWAVLKTIAKHRNAEILVIPMRYKNPTSNWSGSQSNAEYWDPLVRDLLWNVRLPLNKNITVLADMKAQPTASSPVTGSDAMTSGQSSIIGHTKVQLRSVPVPSSSVAKLVTTTGACTVPNFTDSRAGKLGEFHHSQSAVIVELDGDLFHLRHLHFSAEKKRCIDLNVMYGPRGFWKAPPAEALDMGDTHVRFIDPLVERATFGPNGIIDQCNPKNLIYHDLLDSYSVSHHHRKKPFTRLSKLMSGRDDVMAEIEEAVRFVMARGKGRHSVIVPSNHIDHLTQWVEETDWKQDLVNAKTYLQTALQMVEGLQTTNRGAEFPDPFGLWFRKIAGEGVAQILHRDESFKLVGVELGMHGDKGPNGARGSIMNHRRLGVKSIIGHSHVPGIEEGCYQVGTSTLLRLEYNSGASGWMNTHCLLNADGKRQLIHIIKGKYRI
jgi:hypothetical protein